MSLNDIERLLREGFADVNFEARQRGREGEIVGFIREAAGSAGLAINAGPWTHPTTSGLVRPVEGFPEHEDRREARVGSSSRKAWAPVAGARSPGYLTDAPREA